MRDFKRYSPYHTSSDWFRLGELLFRNGQFHRTSHSLVLVVVPVFVEKIRKVFLLSQFSFLY